MPAKKYFKEEFDRILAERFGGNLYRMRHSSRTNFNMVATAIRLGWHQKETGSGKYRRYSVYTVSFPPVYGVHGISVYVGLTARNVRERMAEHANDGESAVNSFARMHGVRIPSPSVVSSGLAPGPAAEAERRKIEEYSLLGWNVLNRDGGGSLGGIAPVRFTVGNVRKIVLGTASAKEMQKRNGWAYEKMMKLAKDGVREWVELRDFAYLKFGKGRTHKGFTFEQILGLAGKHGSLTDMRRNDKTLYTHILRHGWLPDIMEALGWKYLRNRKRIGHL